MPRLYIRNTNKGLVTEERMREAVNAVKNGMKVRKAAREYGIARSTLNNNLTKDREGNGLPTRLVPNYRHSLVFTAKQEADFASYLKDCARMFHGLTTKNDVFYERIKTYKTWKDAEATLGKKRDNKAKLELQNKMDKISQAQAEVTEWEQKVEKCQEDFEKISQNIRKEMARFEKLRVTDFKDGVVKYLEVLLDSQQKLIKYWETFLPEAKAIA